MTWLIVILAMGLLISPLVSSLPSKKQRALGRLRQHALVRGFRIERLEEAGQLYFGYRWQRDMPAQKTVIKQVLSPQDQPEVFAPLPSGVVRIELNVHNILVVWDEKGCEADVDCLAECMRQLYSAHP